MCLVAWRKNIAGSSTWQANKFALWNITSATAVGVALMLILAMICSNVANALPTEETIYFDIPEQRADLSLITFAEQSNRTFMFPFDEAKSKVANRLIGDFPLLEALERLLAGTDLQIAMSEQGHISVFSNQISEGELELKKDKKGNTLLGRVGYALLSLFAASASGQDGQVVSEPQGFVMEEIVVTAQKRSENLQQVPIAISAFSGEAMERSGVKGVLDLNLLSPSIQVGQQDVNTFVSIRGIGAELTNIGGESGVTISQDGMPLVNQTLFDADFFDVDRVEILRGPQGTISGRNATGGAVNIHSNQPTSEFEAEIKAQAGNYDRYGLEGYVSGPIAGDHLMGRLAVRTEKADGWLTNTFRNTDLNDADKTQVRLSLLADITDNFDAYLVLGGMIDKSSPVSTLDLGRARPDQPGYAETFGVPGFDRNRLEFQADYPNERRVEKYDGTLKLSWDFGSSTNLVATTGYLSFDRKARDDFDATIIEGSSFDCTCIDLWQASQELTLTADITDRLDMVVGALYLKSESQEPLVLGLPILGLPVGSIQLLAEQTLTSSAVYSQLRYSLSEDLRISLGARYTQDKKEYTEEDIFFGFSAGVKSGAESWKAFTPRLAVDYIPTDDLTIYASVSRGFKAGGFNTFSGIVDEFSPEFVLSYEAGFKSVLLDGRLRTSAALFYMDYQDLQQSLFVLDAASGLTLPNVKNAADASITGVEMELAWFATDQLKITMSGSWLDATYDELHSNDVLHPELGERDLSGNRLVRAPQWQSSVSAEYRVPLGGEWQASMRTDYAWQDQIYFDFFNHDSLVQESHGLLNIAAFIETTDTRLQFSLFVRNALDERYLNHALVIDGTPQQLHVTVGAPRMYGISVAYNL